MENRIRQLLETPEAASTETWFSNPDLFEAFIGRVFEMVLADPASAEEPAGTIVRHAPTRCLRVQGYGLLIHVYRLLDRKSDTRRALAEAFFIGKGCPACAADLTLRRAVVRRDERLYHEATLDAEEALRRYQELGNAGHDLHRNGISSALNVRGGIWFYRDRPDLAAADYRTALAKLDPHTSPILFRAVVGSLASALAETGNLEDLREAEENLRIAVRAFKGCVGKSAERAKLNWLTAQVRFRLGKDRPKRLRRIMMRSLEDFLALSMPLEAAAISADLMKMKVARPCFGRDDPRDLIRQVLAVLSGGLPKVSRDLHDALEAVADAVQQVGFEQQDTLKTAIDNLRSASGQKAMACLLAW